MPVLGPHSWRQADTAAIARHFAEGGMAWWLPQIDWAGAGPGYVEAEFPLYPYALALLHRLLGVHDELGRLLSLLCSLATIWLLVRLGERLLGPGAGRWGGLIFALSPLAVYYGRSVQAESLLLLLAALCVERLLSWRDSGRRRDLLISWLSFCACALMKVMPLLWLGLAVATWWVPGQSLPRNLRRPGLWLYGLSALALTAAWYLHAHALGESSGLSFGFWAGDTNRYRMALLIGPRYVPELLLRLSLRGLAIAGLPLLLIGAWQTRRQSGGRGLLISAAAVLLAGAMAPESSLVHEYYQLPLLLWLCPLAGAGLAWLVARGTGARRAAVGLLVVFSLCSLTILSLDYWRPERQQAADLLPLAAAIQASTPGQDRIVAVSGGDPTLLNLARRQGWLTDPANVSEASLRQWRAQGARHIAGSFRRVESYRLFSSEQERRNLQTTLCRQLSKADDCHFERPFFVIPLQP